MGSKAETEVHIFPVAGAHIDGVPAIEQDVSASDAATLLAYGGPHNPAFTTEPLSQEQLNDRRLKALEEPPSNPPDEGTDPPTEPAEAGSSDSTEV